MTEIVRNRTIRPSTRLESSPYKIDTKRVSSNDILLVNISHETRPFKKTYRFTGKDLKDKNSIHFSVHESSSRIDIIWSGASPI